MKEKVPVKTLIRLWSAHNFDITSVLITFDHLSISVRDVIEAMVYMTFHCHTFDHIDNVGMALWKEHPNAFIREKIAPISQSPEAMVGVLGDIIRGLINEDKTIEQVTNEVMERMIEVDNFIDGQIALDKLPAPEEK